MTPWQRIMHNARKGTGVRLSAGEVIRLSMDGMIEARALLDDEEDEEARRLARAPEAKREGNQ
jgi:hypothetical protein